MEASLLSSPARDGGAQYGVERRRVSGIGFAYAGLFLASSGLQLAAGAWIAAYHPAWASSQWYLLAVSALPLYAVGVPLCAGLLRRIRPERPAQAPLSVGRWLCFLLMCLALMYGGNLIGLGVTALLNGLLHLGAVNPLEAVVGNVHPAALLLFSVVLAPAFEEYAFRRLLVDRLRRYGDRAAILMSGLMFGLVHGNFSQFFYAFLLGVLFAYVYCRTGRLRYSVLLHAAVNFFGSVAAPFLQQWAGPEALGTLQGSALVFESSMVYRVLILSLYSYLMIGGAIAGVCLLVSRWKRAVFAPGQMPLPRAWRGRVLVFNAGMLAYLALCATMFVAYRVL